MKKNNIKQTFIFTFLVTMLLLLLHYLPPITIFGYPLRQVDILHDIRSELPEETEADDSIDLLIPDDVIPENIPEPTKKQVLVGEKPAITDTCKAGVTCIVDYADSTVRGMQPFYEALARAKESKQPVRIAFFGDSFL